MFFDCDCDTFILAHQVEQVHYMPYPYENLSAWWVVYIVNPREWLHTPNDSSYHENHVAAEEVDEVYQDDEMSCSFNIDPDSTLNSLLNDANDVTVPEQRKQILDIERSLYFYYVLYISYYILVICYYILYISFILSF
jgi:hypothetical protein